MSPNYRLVASSVGDLLKWDTSLNEIGRAADALFRFPREDFPNESITSSRAQLFYDWVLSLAKQRMEPSERDRLLVTFCKAVTPEAHSPAMQDILTQAGIGTPSRDAEARQTLRGRGLHPEVLRHSEELFLQANYFHAVFETAKAYNKAVREKARSGRDGHGLMMDVWSWEKGVLKLTACQTETDRNVQDGIKFLSAGLMHAVRNPTAHEPAVDWPISQPDCLDILSFLSFLFRKLDESVYFAAGGSPA